jgi:hypothetical protein
MTPLIVERETRAGVYPLRRVVADEEGYLSQVW